MLLDITFSALFNQVIWHIFISYLIIASLVFIFQLIYIGLDLLYYDEEDEMLLKVNGVVFVIFLISFAFIDYKSTLIEMWHGSKDFHTLSNFRQFFFGGLVFISAISFIALHIWIANIFLNPDDFFEKLNFLEKFKKISIFKRTSNQDKENREIEPKEVEIKIKYKIFSSNWFKKVLYSLTIKIAVTIIAYIIFLAVKKITGFDPKIPDVTVAALFYLILLIFKPDIEVH